MKFRMSKEWLARRLDLEDDIEIGASGMTLTELKADAESRLVSRSLLEIPSTVGKVIRFAREKRGWSAHDLAEHSRVSPSDILGLEGDGAFSPSPRTIHNVAEALKLAEQELQALVGHRISLRQFAANDSYLSFAANSRNIESLTGDEYEMIRLFVESITRNE
ncbi:helix-turn-helix domain-containing protein [Paraburkholderia acidicola]|uniref:Helix-turn-helix domain-containing protein n=1 Tax=Paraburkholderia acidicola TaxID=1912599 RepID=A0ABV1LLK5_9BURK